MQDGNQGCHAQTVHRYVRKDDQVPKIVKQCEDRIHHCQVQDQDMELTKAKSNIKIWPEQG